LQQGLLGKVRFNVIGPKLQTLLRWPMGIVYLLYGRINYGIVARGGKPLGRVSAGDRTLIVTFRTVLGPTRKKWYKIVSLFVLNAGNMLPDDCRI